jgi:hypothetical protein
MFLPSKFLKQNRNTEEAYSRKTISGDWTAYRAPPFPVREGPRGPIAGTSFYEWASPSSGILCSKRIVRSDCDKPMSYLHSIQVFACRTSSELERFSLRLVACYASTMKGDLAAECALRHRW